jgi:hypothetical protein
LTFDGDRLVVDIDCNAAVTAQVMFEDVIGFRVLDERDLAEFWKEYSEPNGWLWEVQSGGWRDLERTRLGFSSAEIHTDMREFLIVDDKCINVLFRGEVELIEFGPDSTSH